MAALGEGCFVENLGCAAAAAGTEIGSKVAPEFESSSSEALEEAVRVLLEGLGEDCNREGLLRTPLRVAKALRDGTRGYKQEVEDIVGGALFPELGLENKTGFAGGSGGLVFVRGIDLFSYCESCLLPFGIRCHVGYVTSGQRVVGLSKLSRVSDVFAKRLQEPQRLADEVCAALHKSIDPAGVAVALQCWHIESPDSLRCFTSPRNEQPESDTKRWSRISVCSRSGVFAESNASLWTDFSLLLKLRGINIEGSDKKQSFAPPWCPFGPLATTFLTKPETRRDKMFEAVTSILHLLGEDPSRKELVNTPLRYVQWLMNFKTLNLQAEINGFDLGKNGMERRVLNGNTGNYDIRTDLNLPFCSLCEHHLLPFYGVAHIGYFDAPESLSLDRSVLQSLVHHYGFNLQVQERLTKQIAEAIYSFFRVGAMVVVEASHVCMISRGIEKVGSNTATIAVTGRFATDPKAKSVFLQIVSDNISSENKDLCLF